MTTTDPLHVVAVGSRVEHWGQHGASCFGCKLKTIRFGSMQPPTASKKDRWGSDPVVARINELNGITLDTDALNKRSSELSPK